MCSSTIKVTLILLSSILLSCSNSEQRFTCNSDISNDGLTIKNNIASLGFYSDMKYCDKQGTKYIYSSKCKIPNPDEYYALFFDIISYEAEISVKSKDNYNVYTYQCKKVN